MSKFIVFKPQQKRTSVQIRLKLNNKEIEKIKETLFLGILIVLDEHLTWQTHGKQCF